jgi:3-deoxy-manno-octulosonate cytidylyltransferase (CMP-KDO synthetase)
VCTIWCVRVSEAQRVLGVIPARMAAQRFPGKPLEDLAGRPMIQWVHEAAVESGVFDEVLVATPDVAIVTAVEAFGGTAVMTSADHETGTDRVAEVAQMRPDAGVIANVQGDQPFVTAAMLKALVEPFGTVPAPEMTTVAAPLADAADDDPNTVKVVCDAAGDALYFSRSRIPYVRSEEHAVEALHHIGLYAFERGFLMHFATLPATPLERCEGLEQLRALEHGHRVRVARVTSTIVEVNTPSDMDAARALATQEGAR